MHASLKTISLAALIASQCIFANEQYDVTMKLGESYTITLNTKQLANSRSNTGEKVRAAHLWRLDGYNTQTVVHLSDKTTTTDKGETHRVYNEKTGKWNFSAGDLLVGPLFAPSIPHTMTTFPANIVLLPLYVALLPINIALLPISIFFMSPYEQEFLFIGSEIGATTLTFFCERRFCWEAPTKVATVNIHVTEDSGSWCPSWLQSHKLYIN